MSFEMKYDVENVPVKPAQEPVFEELVEQVAQPETPEPVEAAPEPEAKEEQKAPAPQESWKVLRDKAERAQRERDEALAYIQQMQAQKPEQPVVQEPEEEAFTIEEDALVEGKHLKKVSQQLAAMKKQLKDYQKQAAEEHQRTAMSTTEMKLKAQYPDFDAVVCKENLMRLRDLEPELAHSINSNSDIYAKAVSAYKMIKKFGIAVEDTFTEEKAMAQKNSVKPKPLASMSPAQGESPLSKANAFANGKLTEDMKKALLKEMMESRQ